MAAVETPKTQEIERKYVLRRQLDPEHFVTQKAVYQQQGYIPGGGPGAIRVRSEQYIRGGKGFEYWLTIKGPGTLSRHEEEFRLSEPSFKIMWPLTAGHQVNKHRYTFECEGRVYDYDAYRFLNQPELLILETEFATETEALAFVLPEAFGKYEDVTDLSQFKAQFIAEHGRPKTPW